MTDEEIQQRFNDRVNSILDAIYEVDVRAVEAARDKFEKTRLYIVGKLESADSTEPDAARLEHLKPLIENTVDQLERQLVESFEKTSDELVKLGAQLVDDPLLSVGVVNNISGISTELAQVVADLGDNTASMLKEVTDEVTASVSDSINRAATGEITPAAAVEEIGAALDSPGIFKSATARAQAIYRTESLRVQSIATQARMRAHADEVKKAGWQMGKVWGATYDERTRADHRNADGQERGVDEDFTVGGEALMYPRDPKGSAKQTVNCRCYSRPTLTRVQA